MEETFGRYRLLERLGRGAMAEVWKAKSFGVEGFEKILVVKRLLPELARSKRFCDEFVREARLAVRLSHANVVQVFDLGTVTEGETETYYVATEFVAGLDLGTLLSRAREQGAELPVGMCVYVAAEVAKGLEHAHRRRDEQLQPLGMVHRDVRPNHILLSWEGEVKLGNFGIAKARDALGTEAPHLGAGEHGYLSPEQARGQDVDARSDLFSLGVVLYEMLTGVNPLRSPIAFETLRSGGIFDFPPVEALRPDLPEGIGALLDKALAPARDRRFVDAARMYESLASCLYASSDRFGASKLAAFVRRFRAASAPPPSLVAEETDPGIPVYDEDETPVEIPAVPRHSSIRVVDPASASAAAARASELGERRDVTALVFRLGSREAEGARRRARVREIVSRYGGQVIEEDGERLVALFGVVEPDGRDTETAVRCALLALRRAAGADPASSRGGTAADEPFSAGVHAGRILVAGSEPRRDERLEAVLAEASGAAHLRQGACGISPAAARHVLRLFRFEAIAATSSTIGQGGLLVKESRARTSGVGRFVGRKLELRRLGEILWRAARRRAHVVTIRGPAGIGKTRLLFEAERRLRKDDYKIAFYVAPCPPNGAAIAFSGLDAMLQVLSGVREGDAEERIAEVEPRLRALGLLDEEVAAVKNQLSGSRTANAAALRSGFARMVTSLCSDQLHVFAWDAAQALDQASFDVLRHALARAAETRAVFMFLLRDDARLHPFENYPDHHAITLGELDEAETRELIARRAGVDEPPPELIEFCQERAKGHPLFIEELVKELAESGALVFEGSRVVEFNTSGEITMPRPLRTLVAARLMRLSSEEKRALTAASILGDPIESAVLALMLGEPVPKVERIIGSLEERGLLRRTDSFAVSFLSPLFAEVVADALPREGQRQMHAAAALALEAQHGERAVEHAERLAGHLLAAGDRDGAAGYLASSAQHKLVAGRYDAAAHDALLALELCHAVEHDPAELVSWIELVAKALYRVRVAPELPTLLGPVLAHIDKSGDVEERVTARIELASALVSTNEFDAADQSLQAATALAETASPALLRSATLTEAELARRRGDYLGALRRFEELSATAEDPAEAHRILTGLCLCHAASGSPDKARETLERAEALALDGDLASACERAKLRQVVALMSRDFREAVRIGEGAVELAREAGLRYETAVNMHLLGEALFRAGELPRAYATFAQSAALCQEIAEERLLVHNRSFLAYLDSASDHDGALRALEEAIAYAHAHRYVRDEVNARYLLATLKKDQGQADARAEFERCLLLARSVGMRLLVEDCTEALVTGQDLSA